MGDHRIPACMNLMPYWVVFCRQNSLQFQSALEVTEKARTSAVGAAY